MKQKLFPILAALMLTCFGTAYAADSVAEFSDIPASAPYVPAVQYCLDNGLMNGTSETEFSPEENTSRAMLITILYRQQKASATAEEPNRFEDVAATAWYSDAVRWGAAHEIINGVDSTHFAPNSVLTREQILAILWRVAGSNAAETSALPYADTDAISDYAKIAAAWAYENNIIDASAGTALRPADSVTRAELAQLLYSFANVTAENAPSASPSPDETPDIHVTVGDASFDIVLYDSATTQVLMTQVPETNMMLPPSYDLNGNCKYYDIPTSYHDALRIQTEPLTAVKAGDVLLDDNNRLYLYYKDSAISGDYLRVGYVADPSGLPDKLGGDSVTFYVTQY